MSTKRRRTREHAMREMLADDYEAMARRLEGLGHKTVAPVLHERARHHRRLAQEEGQDA